MGKVGGGVRGHEDLVERQQLDASEVLDLGETPWQLEPPRRGRTAAERQAFVESLYDAWSVLGLSTVDGSSVSLRESAPAVPAGTFFSFAMRK